MRHGGFILLILTAVAFLVTPAASAANMLSNPDFGVPATDVPADLTTTLMGQYVGGASPAASWSVWNNSQAITTCRLVPLPPPGGGAMLHVRTTGPYNGLVQMFRPWYYDLTQDPPKLYPTAVRTQMWVYVVSGQVWFGTGFNGIVPPGAVSTITGKWEFLRAEQSGQPLNQLIVYSGHTGAEFYLYDPQLTETTGGSSRGGKAK